MADDIAAVDLRWTPVTGLLYWAQSQPDAVFLSQPHEGVVTDITWAEAEDQVRRMAAYLQSLQLPPGSAIGLLSRNCAQMILADLAIWMAGHVSVPVYPSLNAETLGYILRHCETRLLFLGPLEDWAGMAPGIPPDMPTVVFPQTPDGTAPAGAVPWDTVLSRHAPTATIVPRDPDRLARLVYTSGSTGQPKGVMVPFKAMAVSARLLDHFCDVGPQDRMISYLPLAHVYEAAAVECNGLRHGFRIYFSEGLATFAEDLRRARPTLFHSVPRLWVKFQQGVTSKLPQLDAMLADPAMADGVRRKVLEQLGLQDVRLALTGSAPLPPPVIEWYRNLGLELLEGYAMSEDFAYSHLSRPGRARIGYVGDTNPGVDRRIADNGEVQLRSPGCMMGYYRDAEKTAEAFTEDGWFRTGDRGEVDEEGRLRITGRLKEIFKTSKGKYVSPAPIENKLSHPWVEQTCVCGADQTQPFVLVMPSPLMADTLATEEGQARLTADLDALLTRVNAQLDPHERLAFAVVVPETWTIANNLLTPTMKIRRSAIEARYAAQVEDWVARGDRVIWA